jgi:hypothetical protein
MGLLTEEMRGRKLVVGTDLSLSTKLTKNSYNLCMGAGFVRLLLQKGTWYYNTMKLAYSLSASTFCQALFLPFYNPWELGSDQ